MRLGQSAYSRCCRVVLKLGLEKRDFGKWEVGRAGQLEAAGHTVLEAAVVREDGRR